ncbi:MAG: DUF4143 domain-containing protein [Peptococcaceae bacterium]|nr:MAG: DUF4143 domain-containing protein [Peptococcaceae bacterium]
MELLGQTNLIYISNPVEIGGKKILKARPKVYIADAAIRNAVLMLEDVLSDPGEMSIMVETAVYKHVVSFYYRRRTRVGYYRQTGNRAKEIDVVVDYQPVGRLLIEVKYREDVKISLKEAIVELAELRKILALTDGFRVGFFAGIAGMPGGSGYMFSFIRQSLVLCCPARPRPECISYVKGICGNVKTGRTANSGICYVIMDLNKWM